MVMHMQAAITWRGGPVLPYITPRSLTCRSAPTLSLVASMSIWTGVVLSPSPPAYASSPFPPSPPQDKAKGGFHAEVDEEFEDAQGNVYNRKTFEDLRRQGLI